MSTYHVHVSHKLLWLENIEIIQNHTSKAAFGNTGDVTYMMPSQGAKNLLISGISWISLCNDKVDRWIKCSWVVFDKYGCPFYKPLDDNQVQGLHSVLIEFLCLGICWDHM